MRCLRPARHAPPAPAAATTPGCVCPRHVGKIKLKKPVLVYYEQAAPGKAVQQLIMAEENLGLLKTLDLEAHEPP